MNVEALGTLLLSFFCLIVFLIAHRHQPESEEKPLMHALRAHLAKPATDARLAQIERGWDRRLKVARARAAQYRRDLDATRAQRDSRRTAALASRRARREAERRLLDWARGQVSQEASRRRLRVVGGSVHDTVSQGETAQH